MTTPTPELPTEPGLYVDARGIAGPVWRVRGDHTIGQVGGYGRSEDAPLPFTPLAPERPQVSREAIELEILTASSRSAARRIHRLVYGDTE